MKIISNYKDYYDHVAALGVDDTIRYIRHIRDVQVSKNTMSALSHTLFTSYSNDISSAIIGFCGKYYPCVSIADHEAPSTGFYFFSLDGKKHEYRQISETYKRHYCFTLAHVESCRKIISKKQDRKKGYTWRSNEPVVEELDRYYKKIEGFLNKSSFFPETDNLYAVEKTPIFTCIGSRRSSEVSIRVNPFLKEFDFQKVVNPYDAFQLISSYISGVIGTQNVNTSEISDKYQVLKKGFDPIYGFRKRPVNA